MPAKMRASLISSRAAEKLRKERTTPGIRSDSDWKRVVWPKNLASTRAAAPLTVECPDGYSGWLGVANRGCHVGSSTVAGFPSVAARGMAVTGRQKTKWYFASQHAMPASAI